MRKKLMTLLLACFMLPTSLIHASTGYETCPNKNPYHILVNKTHPISKDYVPQNLVKPKVTFETPGNLQKNYMEKTAAKALEEMFAAAKADHIKLVAVSGYRSYSRQTTLYNRAVATLGKDQNGTAKPGESEHQTGLAMDLNSVSQSFEYTAEGQWLKNNAHLYGYIIRYPKNKTEITGYIYEPWHVRYVGKELAAYCYTNNLTLEEVMSCCFPYNAFTATLENTHTEVTKEFELLSIDQTTYIKARDLSEFIQATLTFSENKNLKLTTEAHELTVLQNSRHAQIDGSHLVLTSTPLIIEHTYYLPLRSTVQALGYELTYVNAQNYIIY